MAVGVLGKLDKRMGWLKLMNANDAWVCIALRGYCAHPLRVPDVRKKD